MQVRFASLLTAAGLSLLLPSCLITIDDDGLTTGIGGESVRRGPPVQEAGAPGDADEKDEEPDLEALAHKVEIGRMELDVARLKTEGAERDAESSVHTAEIELDHARQALAKAEADGGLKQIEAELGLDRSRFRLDEQKAELAELESMYAAEEFAEKTKELVLTRGKRSVEVAERSLKIAERRLDILAKLELPASRAKAELGLVKAELALGKARLGAKRALLEARIALEKAERSLHEAEKKLAEASEQ